MKELLEYIVEADSNLEGAIKSLRDYSIQGDWNGETRIIEATTYWNSNRWSEGTRPPKLSGGTQYSLCVGIKRIGSCQLTYNGDGKIYISEVKIDSQLPFAIGEAMTSPLREPAAPRGGLHERVAQEA